MKNVILPLLLASTTLLAGCTSLSSSVSQPVSSAFFIHQANLAAKCAKAPVLYTNNTTHPSLYLADGQQCPRGDI